MASPTARQTQEETMRVEARTIARAAAALVTSTIVAAGVACGGGESQQQATPAATASPAPKVLTAAERATRYQDCWTQFNNKAWDQFKACYADTVESEQVDSGQPVAQGIEAVLASSKTITSTFPDMKGTGQLILVNGNTMVGVYLISGTHTSPLTGPGGQSIPATNKPIGYLQAHLAQTDSTGGKAVKEEFYSDSGTMMAQLGLSPGPARPVTPSTTAAPKVVVAAGTPAEMSNVEASRVQMAAFNSHDAKGVDAYNAPDSVYHDMGMPKDQTAKENLAGTVDMFKAFPDAKLATSSIWGAGDYVVVVGRFEGTNKGPMAAMGIKKATGKSVSVRYLDIARWEGGKVKEEWLFYNGMAMAGQLGMMGK
jgi:predicted ester cyclase